MALIPSADKIHTLCAVQTSVDDKEAGHVVSAINCYFMCQVSTPLDIQGL